MARKRGNFVSFELDKSSLTRTINELTDLSYAASQKQSERILRSAVKPIKDEMIRNAPLETGRNIIKNIGITTAQKRTKNSGGVRVGVTGKKLANPKLKFSAPALAGSLEYGTGERRKEDGSATGVIESKPFLRPAYDNNIGNVTRRVEKSIQRLVKRRTKLTNKK